MLACMADDGFSLVLDPALAKRLKAAADAAGQPVLDFAESLIVQGLDDDWAVDYARFAEYEPHRPDRFGRR